MLVSVVIVSYNGERFLRGCLDALAHQEVPRYRYEVIVVDNASRDGTVALIENEYSWVQLVRSRKNLGFAGGNNLGIAAAHGDWIVLLNNDTQVDPHWLGELIRCAERHPEALGIASKLVFHAEGALLNSSGLYLCRDGRGKDRSFRSPDRGEREATGETFGGCGAGLLIRRDRWNESKIFDDDWFMYYEDLDFAWRARLRGERFYYEPASLVRHIHCGSSGEWSPFFCYHVERNRVASAFRNGDVLVVLTALLGSAARTVREAMRCLLCVGQRRQHWAVLKALAAANLSILMRLPKWWWQRYTLRSRRWCPSFSTRPCRRADV